MRRSIGLLCVALGLAGLSAGVARADLPPPPPPPPPPADGEPQDPEPATPEPVAYRADDLEWLVKVPPQYPEQAREIGLEGEVLLQVVLGTNGAPEEIEVLMGKQPFSDAAQRAVAAWRAKPVELAGRPVRARVQIRLEFALR